MHIIIIYLYIFDVNYSYGFLPFGHFVRKYHLIPHIPTPIVIRLAQLPDIVIIILAHGVWISPKVPISATSSIRSDTIASTRPMVFMAILTGACRLWDLTNVTIAEITLQNA